MQIGKGIKIKLIKKKVFFNIITFLLEKNKNIKSKNIEASDFSLKPMISQRKKNLL